MKKPIFILILILLCFAGSAQNYTKIYNKYEWVLGGRADSGWILPAYAGQPNTRAGVGTMAGNIGIDSVNNRVWFFSGSTWHRIANTSEAGRVDSVSAQNLSPLFTTVVNNPTTIADIVYTLSNTTQYKVFGRSASGSGVPSYISLDTNFIAGFSTMVRPLISLTTNAGSTTYNSTTGVLNIPPEVGAGTVTDVSVVNTNGFSGSVNDPTVSPDITILTTVTDNQLIRASSGAIVGSANLTYDGSLVTGLSAGLGTTQDDTKGLLLTNTTAAAAGAQQISPSLHWRGQGWKTNATAASQSVDFRSYVLPVQGTANPSGNWKLQQSINGGAYSDVIAFGSLGEIFTGAGSAGTTNQAILSGGPDAAWSWGTVDLSASNELQTIAVTGTTTGITTLSNSGGSMTIAGAGINTVGVSGSTITITGTEVDGSTSNELQTLSGSGTSSPTVTLSDGGGAFSITGAGIAVASRSGLDITITATEVDGSTTNELQTLSTSGTTTPTVTLSNGGGSFSITGAGIASLSRSGDAFTVTATEVDGSTSNELQTIAVTGTTTGITTLSNGGGSMTIAGAGINTVGVSGSTITVTGTEVDGSTTNELQTIANTSDATSHTVTLSNSGGSVQLIEGTGITLTTGGSGSAGTVTITSTASASFEVINGLHLDAPDSIKLGGFLIENTEINGDEAAYDMAFASIDSFSVDAVNINLNAGASGAVSLGGKIYYTTDISPTSIGSNQNDYSPTDFTTASVLRLTSDASRNITGLAGGADGRTLKIFNVGSNDIVLKDQDANSTAANRFELLGDKTIKPGDGIDLWYDETTDRWRAATVTQQLTASEVLGNSRITLSNSEGTYFEIAAGSGISIAQTGSANASVTTISSTNTGTVTDVSVVTANGFQGSVANASTSPDITLETSVTSTQLIYANSGDIAGVSGVTSDGTNVTAGSGNLRATRPRVTTSIDDINGLKVLGLTPVSSAVNNITITNAVTNGEPIISAEGSDSDISIVFQAKGATPWYSFQATSGGSSALFLYEDTDNGTNYIGFQPPASVTNSNLYTLPTDYPSVSDKAMVSDVNGIMSWGPVIASGTYSPSGYLIANAGSLTTYDCQYMRVGNVVTVSGKIDLTWTTDNTLTRFGISLPVASDLAQEYQLGGTANSEGSVANGHLSVKANTADNHAEFYGYSPASGESITYFFTFTYRVL